MNMCELACKLDKYKMLKNSTYMKERYGQHRKCVGRLMNNDSCKMFKDYISKDLDKNYVDFIMLASIDDYSASKALYEYGDESLAKHIYRTGRCIDFKRFSKYKEYLKKIYDKNMELKERYGDVVVDEKLINMVDDRDRWLNYRLLYGKKIKDVIEDRYMGIDLIDNILKVLEGANNEKDIQSNG